ncbi:MAG: class I SAM-dependent methyltransferase, partial [Halodesulfurarchaeum sp.]
MPRTDPFEEHTDRYEAWFDAHEPAYESEVAALEQLIGDPGTGLEIGVGTGRFGAPLGIQVGVDPAMEMLEYARRRGIDAVRGIAEALPVADTRFDTALIVTTICFVEDIAQTLAEAYRVLRPGGALVLGYIDKDSPVGTRYQATKADNPFYRDATFVSTEELVAALETAGFTAFEFVQTIFTWPEDIQE